MSISRDEIITCPKCGNQAPFMIWRSVKTMIDPEMKAAVRDGSAFLFTCPKCGNQAVIDYGFLYHQMEDRIMIFYAETDEDAEGFMSSFRKDKFPVEMQDILGDFLNDNYLVRIVRSRYELREKLEIFDAGLDDRIIEIFKIFLYIKFLERGSKGEKIEMYFEHDDQRNIIHILEDGRYTAGSEITQSAYENIAKEYRRHLPDIRKDDPVIDRNYVLRFFKSVAKDG